MIRPPGPGALLAWNLNRGIGWHQFVTHLFGEISDGSQMLLLEALLISLRPLMFSLFGFAVRVIQALNGSRPTL